MTRRLSPFLAIALLAWAPGQQADSSATGEKVQQSHFFKNPMLVGVVEPVELRQDPFADWFTRGYENYEIQPDALAHLRGALADEAISIEIFFGTWCHDSRRELPRMMRVLDETRFPASRVTLYALSDHPGVFKMTPDGREHELLVHRTATFVVLRDGVEVGRIVERPAQSLEEDLMAILAGAPQPLPYRAESAIHSLYRADDRTLVRAPTRAFLDELETLGDTETLWHYAQYDLLFNGKPADAADVLHLFLTLHPDSALGYRLLAQAESDLDHRGAALLAVRRARALAPGSAAARGLEETILAKTRRPATTQVDQASAAAYFEEAQELCEREGGRLWGVSLCGPMVFADAMTHTLATNRPAPSPEWPQSLGYANAAMRWGDERWSTYVWQYVPANADLRARLMMHELFHRVQFGLELMTATGNNEHLDTLEGRYWLQLEWRALAAALRSSGAERTAALRDALAFRVSRHTAFPEAAENERLEEIREGLAQYTGTVAATASVTAATANAVGQLEQAPQQPGFVRTAAYTSGVAYGILLDAWSPGWTRRIRATDDLARLLMAAADVGPAGDATTAAERYDGAALHASEEQREIAHQARVDELRQRFVEGPILIVPRASGASFVTTGATAIPGAGTTLSTYRLTAAWGSLEAATVLVSSDGTTLRLPAPASVAGTSLAGFGWTLELASGWAAQPGPRAGDFQVARVDR